jgi:hypothetical protein
MLGHTRRSSIDEIQPVGDCAHFYRHCERVLSILATKPRPIFITRYGSTFGLLGRRATGVPLVVDKKTRDVLYRVQACDAQRGDERDHEPPSRHINDRVQMVPAATVMSCRQMFISFSPRTSHLAIFMTPPPSLTSCLRFSKTWVV